MLGTTLNYDALRFLGEGTEDGKHGAIAKARKWILDHGGATVIPFWGTRCSEYMNGQAAILCRPQDSGCCHHCLPFSPAKLWFYLPTVDTLMSYLHGATFALGCCSLRWRDTPTKLAILQTGQRESSAESSKTDSLYEDENTGYITQGPTQKMMACWAEDPTSDAFKLHLAQVPDFSWVAEDGMKLQECMYAFKTNQYFREFEFKSPNSNSLSGVHTEVFKTFLYM